jgi:hypothetical protein
MKARALVKKHTGGSEERGPEASEKATPRAAVSKVKPFIAVTAAVFCLAVYLLRLDEVVGSLLDDAWYVLLGQALAAGQGYTLTNSPSPGISPLYPPLFPLALALVFKIAPAFPQNVWLLKAVSITSALATAAISYRYFTRYRRTPEAVAAAISLTFLLNPALVFLATSTVMSECFFTLIQMLTVVLVERCASEERPNPACWWAAGAGAAAGLAFLTRSISAALAVAALVYFLRHRLLRQAAAFALGAGLLAGPWALYSRSRTPTEAQQAEQNSHIVVPYGKQFWLKSTASTEEVSLGAIPQRVLDNALTIAGQSTGELLAPSLYRPARLSGMEVFGATTGSAWIKALALALGALIAVGFFSALAQGVTFAEVYLSVYLVVIALWPWHPTRFVLPLLPFLIFYLLRGSQVLYRHAGGVTAQSQARLALIMTVGVAAPYAYDHLNYILIRRHPEGANAPVWINAFKAYETSLEWLRQNRPPDGGVLAASNPALAHLYTGIKTINNARPAENWELWKKLNVRYFQHVGAPPALPSPPDGTPSYRPIYQTAKGPQADRSVGIRIYDLGPPASRP